jgi:N-sulfoglucosamine sulfohydrolase
MRLVLVLIGLCAVMFTSPIDAADRPNILLAIADDWSHPYASAYGSKMVKTPAFDRVAKEGVLFRNAFTATPGCSPSRAALLTGQHSWRLREAGTHASSFPKDLQVYPDILEKAGYFVGVCGKAWGPGNFQTSGWERNPAGRGYNVRAENPPAGMSNTDYAASFASFLKARPKDQPFCFWYGCQEPHRAYEKGSGLKVSKKLADAEVPPFLPDTPEVRGDLLDYAVEIEHFDRHLGKMLAALEAAGELDNTLVIVCSDNGMPFPRAKANLYEYGTHMPLAIRWPAKVKGGRTVSDFASHVDLAPTFLAACGLPIPEVMTGRNLLPVLTRDPAQDDKPLTDHVYLARERHSSSRPNNLGYPCRAIRTADYLYIRNFKPDLWPAGDPKTKDGKDAYHDIDGGPSLSQLVAGKNDPALKPFLDLAVAKRPTEELFFLKDDPATIKNVAADPAHAAAKARLRVQLDDFLTKTGDARMTANGDVWETYPRYSAIREFP